MEQSFNMNNVILFKIESKYLRFYCPSLSLLYPNIDVCFIMGNDGMYYNVTTFKDLKNKIIL